MKILRTYLKLLFFLLVNQLNFSQTFDYISPKNNSILVSLSTNIILKSTVNIDPASLTQNEFSVLGTVSGEHYGSVKLSDNSKTILFIPAKPFSTGENVNVNINLGIKSSDGKALPAVSIHFKTTPVLNNIDINSVSYSDNETINSTEITSLNYNGSKKHLAGDSLPSDFPQITVGTSSNPAPGSIFITNKSQGTSSSIGSYLMILNNDGSIAKYKKLTQMANLFKMEANGDLSYAYPNGAGGWFVLDTSLTPIDTFQCGNGYHADAHDFILLPNGHALLFANDQEPVDMSEIISGGNPDAMVTGLVVQELDASKNVIFQWRSWDYIPITDSYFDLTQANVDLIHANSLALDNDGNILVSMRHLSSIVKINRETGDVMWMLGGKQNDFTFINEHKSNAPTYFSYQHDISILPDGNITLFDNGEQHSPNYSRGVEYALDELNKTATLVWEYRHTPDIYASSMGSVERLPNGNTIVGWGQASGGSIPVFTEVHPDTSTALEFFMPAGQFSYRSYNYQWVSQIPEASATSSGILQGNTYKFNNLNDSTGISVIFNQLNSSPYANVVVTSFKYAPLNPVFAASAPLLASNYFNINGSGFNSYTGQVQVNLSDFPAITSPKITIVYARLNSDSNFISLPTSYDSTKNELTFAASTLGDFAFGIPQTIDSAYAPVPISPSDSEIVLEAAPVKLNWGTRGIVQTYHLQVSTNASFTNLVVDNSNLNSTSYSLNSVGSNSTYYWRINNTNTAGTSVWSNTEVFNTAPAFIKVLSPNGGEVLYLDSTCIIRWQANITDTVNIKLLKGNSTVSVIGNSLAGGTNAYAWQVPSSLNQDTSYKIMVSDISNNSLYGLSSSTFKISSLITGVNSMKNNIIKYELSQNYPNPFNPSTNISFSLEKSSNVTLVVYNILGQKVATLVNNFMQAGNYTYQFNAGKLASGIYIYRIQAGSFTSSKKLVLMK
jgi:hypothetical protein